MKEFRSRRLRVWENINRTMQEFKVLLLGYRSYTALLTQTGTDAPVATVLENTIGEIEFVYDGEASYYINNENFTYTKTFVLINMTNDDGTSFRPCSTSSNNGFITLYTESDEWQAKIEIRVYN